MRTSLKVDELALYASACCGVEVLFDKDDVFPRCPACEHLCFWRFIEEVVSWKDLQDDSLVA